MRTIDLVRRLAAKYIPTTYIVFGRYYIRSKLGGGFEAGSLSLTSPTGNNETVGSDPSWYPNTPSNIDGRMSVILGATGPQSDKLYLANASYNENYLATTDSATGTVYHYNRIYSSENYPTGNANGSILRAHYQMSASINGRSVSNDNYELVDDIFVNVMSTRQTVSQDKLRRELSTFTRLTSKQTGYVDRQYFRQLTGAPAKIISEIIADTGTVRTWKVELYSGALADGTYRRNSSGDIVTGGTTHTIEIRTLNKQVVTLATTVLEISGYRSIGAATVENSTAWLNVDIDPAVSDLVRRNDTGSGITSTVFRLFDGRVRLRSASGGMQCSIDNGAWFDISSSISSVGISTLGDRWCRDADGYPGTIVFNTPKNL